MHREASREREEEKMRGDKKNMRKSEQVKKSDGFVDDEDVKFVFKRQVFWQDRCKTERAAEDSLCVCVCVCVCVGS